MAIDLGIERYFLFFGYLKFQTLGNWTSKKTPKECSLAMEDGIEGLEQELRKDKIFVPVSQFNGKSWMPMFWKANKFCRHRARNNIIISVYSNSSGFLRRISTHDSFTSSM